MATIPRTDRLPVRLARAVDTLTRTAQCIHLSGERLKRSQDIEEKSDELCCRSREMIHQSRALLAGHQKAPKQSG
jgi:hypothetical protein